MTACGATQDTLSGDDRPVTRFCGAEKRKRVKPRGAKTGPASSLPPSDAPLPAGCVCGCCRSCIGRPRSPGASQSRPRSNGTSASTPMPFSALAQRAPVRQRARRAVDRPRRGQRILLAGGGLAPCLALGAPRMDLWHPPDGNLRRDPGQAPHAAGAASSVPYRLTPVSPGLHRGLGRKLSLYSQMLSRRAMAQS